MSRRPQHYAPRGGDMERDMPVSAADDARERHSERDQAYRHALGITAGGALPRQLGHASGHARPGEHPV